MGFVCKLGLRVESAGCEAQEFSDASIGVRVAALKQRFRFTYLHNNLGVNNNLGKVRTHMLAFRASVLGGSEFKTCTDASRFRTWDRYPFSTLASWGQGLQLGI